MEIDDWITYASAAIGLIVLFAIARLNRGIKLVNNRINLISQAQKDLARQVRKLGAEEPEEAALQKLEDDLKHRLDREFGPS